MNEQESGMIKKKMPCILFEDEHWVIVNKPSGVNTHRPDVDAPWGIAEILAEMMERKEPLGIHQRLDKETSGVMVFAKTGEANQSLSEQFEQRHAHKVYWFATCGRSDRPHFTVEDPVDGKPAKTEFARLRELWKGGELWEARPGTGRTHQIRLHAIRGGLPIVGESLRGQESENPPLLLHAVRLELKHPVSGQSMIFSAPLPTYFEMPQSQDRAWNASLALREAFIVPSETDAFRFIHRAGDGFSGLTVDCLAGWQYIEDFLGNEEEVESLLVLSHRYRGKGCRGYVLCSAPQGKRRETKQTIGTPTPPTALVVKENGVYYEVRMMSPGAVGLFLDQRFNRQRIKRIASGKTILNLFSYTCGFSVAAAVGGATKTVSVDLSRPALEWGKANFDHNGLRLDSHFFWAWDTWDALKKIQVRGEKFDIIVLDPPSFSRNKSGKVFSVQKDLSKMVTLCAEGLTLDGKMLVCCNLATWKIKDFTREIKTAFEKSGRKIKKVEIVPQSFDFTVSQQNPPYFKSIWIEALS